MNKLYLGIQTDVSSSVHRHGSVPKSATKHRGDHNKIAQGRSESKTQAKVQAEYPTNQATVPKGQIRKSVNTRNRVKTQGQNTGDQNQKERSVVSLGKQYLALNLTIARANILTKQVM